MMKMKSVFLLISILASFHGMGAVNNGYYDNVDSIKWEIETNEEVRDRAFVILKNGQALWINLENDEEEESNRGRIQLACYSETSGTGGGCGDWNWK